MIGIFDSGVGGICAFKQVRELLPNEDIIYLADRRNAPYGTKTPYEILRFTENNIKKLKSCGAEQILIACCTASSLYERLPPWAREISLPIIRPAAIKAAEAGQNIAVIATRHTCKIKAFKSEIEKISFAKVFEFAEQELVTLVEMGNRDGRIDRECEEYLAHMAERVRATRADTLILGCTHFSHLECEIQGLLPEIKIISPAKVGAMEIVKKINSQNQENGKTRYISPSVKD